MALEVGTDIRDQKLPYMFETVDAQGNPLEQYILPINPESYDLSHSTRTNVTQTLGGAFEDNTGLGLPRISMQGTFGYLGTLVGGHGRSLSSIPKDGWE